MRIPGYGLLWILILLSSVQAGIEGIDVGPELDTYVVGQRIDPSVTLHLNGIINDQLVFVDYAGFQWNSYLRALLQASGYTLGVSGGFQTANPSSSKSLTFTGANSLWTFFRLPEKSQVDSVEFSITGFPYQTSGVLLPSIDVGGDGSVEWQYMGSLTGFGSLVAPSGLDELQESSSILGNQDTFLCERVALEHAKDFVILARYGSYNNGGDLKAYLMQSPNVTTNASFSGMSLGSCDLPEDSLSNGLQWHNCSVSTLSTSGGHLICVHNDALGPSGQSIDFYSVSRDDHGEDAFVCGPLSGGKTSCTSYGTGDFFLKARSGMYDSVLVSKKAMLSQWLTPTSFLSSLNNALKQCAPLQGFCSVGMKVSGGSAGILVFDSLQLKYHQVPGPSGLETKFYDGSSVGTSIVSLNGKPLVNASETVPLFLDSLNILAMTPTGESGNFSLTVSIGNLSNSTDIEVLLNKTIGSVVSSNANGALQIAKQKMQALKSMYGELLGLLGYDVDGAFSALAGLQQKVNGLGGNMSASEIKAKDGEILREINATLANLPKYISVIGTSESVQTFSGKIPDNVYESGKRSADYRAFAERRQREAVIQVELAVYEMGDAHGSTSVWSLVRKRIGGVGNGHVVEIIPVSDLGQVKFLDEPDAKTAGISRWLNRQLGNFQLSYLVSGDVSSSVGSFITYLLPEMVEESEESVTRCGDGSCTKIRIGDQLVALEDETSCPQDCKGRDWGKTFLVVFFVGLAAGGLSYYFFFYRGAYSIQKLFSKKPKFSNPGEEQRLIKYIEQAFHRKTSVEEIRRVLLTKGWGKEQVDFCIGKATGGSKSGKDISKDLSILERLGKQ